MGYRHIPNLYKDQRILQFKYVYALEKLHGTSAHIKWQDVQQNHDGATLMGLKFFSGGEKHEKFVALFNQEELAAKFKEKFGEVPVTVYGEAYGGSCQGMSGTYGKDLKFGVFEVKIGDSWLDIPNAADVAFNLGLEYVPYEFVPTNMIAIDAERDRPSVQAQRNGMGTDKKREGVVLFPPFQVTLNNGERLSAKHKNAEFSERKNEPKVIDGAQLEIIQNATLVAQEWVTAMRLEHVINRLVSERENKSVGMEDTPKVIALMIEDVTREAEGEIIDSKDVRKAISSHTVKMFKQKVQNICG